MRKPVWRVQAWNSHWVQGDIAHCRELARELKTDVLPKLQAKGVKSFLVRSCCSSR